MVVSPYGSWTSPITSDLVVAAAIRLDQIALDADAIYWTESQPQKQGRSFIYRADEGGEAELVTPDDANAFNVRTRAHEYGGGAFAVQNRTVYFSNFADQRLYRQDAGGQPHPITPLLTAAAASDQSVARPAGDPAEGLRGPAATDAVKETPIRADALRYADGDIDQRRGRIICVREDHTRPGEAINTLVSVDISGTQAQQVLVSGNDFYSTPRLSRDGSRLAWLTWNHPNMPWIATEAWVGEIQADGMVGNARRVAGGPDESVFQPEWSPDGDLFFVSDRGAGWWNLYRHRDGVTEPMAPMDAEFGRPQWMFGMSTYAFESAERLICCFVRDGVWKLAQVDTRTKRVDLIPTQFTNISQLRAGPGRVVFFGGTPSEAPALIDLNLSTGTHRVIRRSSALPEGVRSYTSFPEPIAFPTEGGETAHAFFYAPFSPQFTAPEGEKAPV